MSDSPETRRARELLASVDRTLEESRNRPYRVPEFDDGPRFTREAQEMIDRQAAERTAVEQYKAGLNARMVNVARNEAKKYAEIWAKSAIKAVREKYEPMFAEQQQRIEALESEIKGLKQRQPAPSEEWPLRVVGGKR